jgi:hypothetical protein
MEAALSNWQDLYRPGAEAERLKAAKQVPQPQASRQSLVLLRITVRAFVVANLGLLAIAIWSAVIFNDRFHVYQAAALGAGDFDRMHRSDHAVAVSKGGVVPLLVLVFVMLAFWTWTAQTVARQLHPRMEGNPAMAFWGWFIPLAGVIIGPATLARIWRSTDEDMKRVSDLFPVVVGFWAIGATACLGLAARTALWATYWAQGDDENVSHAADLSSTGYWLVAAFAALNIALVVTMSLRLQLAAKRTAALHAA